MKELLSNVFSKQFIKDFISFAGLCIVLILLTFVEGPYSTPIFMVLVNCALASIFTVPIGFLLFVIILVRRLFNQGYRPLMQIRIIVMMVGLPFFSWTSYFLANEVHFFTQKRIRYHAAEELIAELEQYKQQKGKYPSSTGVVPAGFSSKQRCMNNHIGYCTQGDTYRIYFGLNSYLFTYYNYSYCPDWSKVPKESLLGTATEKANWRVETGVD
jgi:hypothetical protein